MLKRVSPLLPLFLLVTWLACAGAPVGIRRSAMCAAGGAGGAGGASSSSASSSASSTASSSASSSSSTSGAGGADAGGPSPGILIALTKFDCAIGTNVDGSSCPSDVGWQDTPRTAGVGCDGSQASLGDSGPSWAQGPNGTHSKYVAWTAGALPGGLVIDGNAIELNDKYEQSRLFRRLKTWARLEPGFAALLGTRADQAGHFFFEHGSIVLTMVGYELTADTNQTYCFGHWNYGLGASSCMATTKTEEVVQVGPNRFGNNWGLMRTTQGVTSLGPSTWFTDVLLDLTPREYTLELDFDSTDPVSSPDQSVDIGGNPTPQSVPSPACPTAAPCHVRARVWMDATVNLSTFAPNEAPKIDRVLTNLNNVVGVQGGVDVLELGCNEQSGADTLHDGVLKWVGIGTTFYASRGFQ